VWEQGSIGGSWQVSMDKLMDKNLPYFVGRNLATLVHGAVLHKRTNGEHSHFLTKPAAYLFLLNESLLHSL